MRTQKNETAAYPGAQTNHTNPSRSSTWLRATPAHHTTTKPVPNHGHSQIRQQATTTPKHASTVPALSLPTAQHDSPRSGREDTAMKRTKHKFSRYQEINPEYSSTSETLQLHPDTIGTVKPQNALRPVPNQPQANPHPPAGGQPRAAQSSNSLFQTPPAGGSTPLSPRIPKAFGTSSGPTSKTTISPPPNNGLCTACGVV